MVTYVYNKRKNDGKVLIRNLLVLLCIFSVAGCSSLMSKATSDMASNLNTAILNQDDPETVRDGAPAYLLMLDSVISGSPNDPSILAAASELYAVYGVVFVDDPARADRLTRRSRSYAERGLCSTNTRACELDELTYEAFVMRLEQLGKKDVGSLYTYGLSWIAYIKVHSADFSALTKLPRVEAILNRVPELNPDYEQVKVQHYLGILKTLRPPALGGLFDEGQAHYERAIELSGGQNLSIYVDYARYYARTLYDRELHDRLLNQVLSADPVQEGNTLFNILAQRDAQVMLDSADDFF
jgi:hypothetical protein